jgi:2,6-dihydroxypyridine 3-monooxygenase
VVGGSLGGLTAARLLDDLGWHVTVFERSPTPLDGLGAGIVMHDATARWPVQRGGRAIDTLSCGSSAIQTFGADGSLLFSEPSPYRFTSWTTLYRSLLAGFDPARYRLGESLESLAQDDAGVTLRFASGAEQRVELAVCADGIDSTARRLLLGVIKPEYSGYVGWRGMVNEAELSSGAFAVLGDALTYGLADRSHIVAYPVPNTDGAVEPGRRLVNYVWYRNVAAGHDLAELTTTRSGERRPMSVRPGDVQDRFVAALRKAANDELAAPLAEMVVRTPQPFIQVIVDIRSPQMAFGRVAMLGDAAFAARPHAAAGTAKAAENAWTLASALAAADDVPTALAAWAPGQLKLGDHLVTRARDIGERSQIHNSWIPGDPDLRFGLYGPGR